MKIKLNGALDGAPKLFTAIMLSALLVACGGGTAGDETDAGTATAGTAGTDGDLGGDDDGFSDLDLGGDTDGNGLDTDGDGLIDDTDGNGISDADELLVCKGLGGSDPGSSNAEWNDNCYIQLDIDTDTSEVDRSPFYYSTYSQGIQRVLYCRGHGGVVDSIDAFADGFFGPNTDTAVRAFQKAEGITVDGIVGEETWGAMQALVDDSALYIFEDSDAAYSAYGVAQSPDSEIDCSQMTNFFGVFSTDGLDEDAFESWEMAKTAGENVKGAFSIEPPQ